MKTRIRLLSSILAVLLLLFLIIMLRIDVHGVTVFYDMRLIYTIDDVRRTMEILLSPSGTMSVAELQALQQQFELFYIIDILFPLVYASLLASIAQALHIKRIIPLIIATMVFDYVENIVILLFYKVFDVGIAFTWILHIATWLKFILMFTSIGWILYTIYKRRTANKKTP